MLFTVGSPYRPLRELVPVYGIHMDFPKSHLHRQNDSFLLVHSMVHKLAAYRYLINKTHYLPLNTPNKHKKCNTIPHIAKTNGFPHSVFSKLNI
jgi:hypothetical protein